MLENISSGFSKNKDIFPSLGEKAKPKANTGLDKLNAAIAKNSKTDHAKKIILASKGDIGYQPCFDLDDDGILTLEEFNQYCSEQGVSEEDKLKLLSVMQSAKMTEKLQEETKKAKEEKETGTETSSSEKGKSIYARKGDRKYDSRMDENNDSIVTYQEYQKYCEDIANKNSENKETSTSDKEPTFEEKQAKNAYQEPKEEPQISIEAQA